MKFIVSIILIARLSFAACLYLPWWSIAPVAFIIAVLIPQGAFMSFISGFLSLFLFWGLLSFWISSSNENILAHKISLLILKIDSPYLLMIATGLIGGLVAGMASLAGSFIRRKKVAY
jgi:hypothetical protein